MNATLLLGHLDRVSEAPDALARLRGFVLELAVRGRLVSQNQTDEPASELLQRIQAEKGRLAGARRTKPFSPVDPAEVPFDIPTSWEWVRVRQVTTDRGQTIPSKDFTYIDVGAIDQTTGRLASPEVVSAEDAPSRARKVVCTGDVLYSCVRPYLLNVAVIEKDILPSPIASTAFAVLDGFGLVLPKYLWAVLRSRFMVECVESKMRGQAYPAINDADFAQLPLPLPPVAEQHRIAAKVDELMALCDRLEAAQAERERRRDHVTAASLNRLNQPSAEAPTFREHVRFHLDHLPRLVTQARHVEQLRQTILNLAACGRLVRQDPNDEPAVELVKRIRAEKAQLVTDGNLRRRSDLPPIRSSELPFDVPPTWQWTRLGVVCSLITDGAHHTPKYEAQGVPFLSVKDVSSGTIDFSDTKFITEAAHRQLVKRCNPQLGDILLTKVGTTGIAVTVDEDTEFSIFVSLALLKFSQANLDRSYLRNVINSPYVRRLSAANTQGIGNKNLVLRLINQFVIPIPPLAEQRRIVARVDELMVICDRLETSLATAQLESRRLLEAVLHDALASSSHFGRRRRGVGELITSA